MKSKNILNTIIALILLTGITMAQIPTTPAITFSTRTFETDLSNAVAPNVMGYQWVLIKDGQVVSERAGGFAQNTADGLLPMTINTPTNIGSLAKFLSGTAMLNVMEKSPVGSIDAGLPLSQKLDRNFTTIVPTVWTVGMQDGVDDISFRQLLQHRSGFDTDKVGNRTVLGYMKDDNGFDPAQFNSREYANINFVLNGYLLSMYHSAYLKNYFNAIITANNYDEATADTYVRNVSGTMMHNIMKTRLWDKMTPKVSPNCDAANTQENIAAYGYDSKLDQTAGTITSAIDKAGHCVGQGGYYLSGKGLATYMKYFSTTDLIVNAETRNLMYSEGMPVTDRLVWGSSTANGWTGSKFGMPNIIWSNGIAGGYRSVIVRLPMNYYLVLLTNSPDLSAGDLYNAGVTAWRAGMEHNF